MSFGIFLPPNSDYEHEYRTALKLVSLINQIVPLRHLVRWKKKFGENPLDGLQKMLWKGLTKEKDKDAELPDLETEVFQVLIETLPSANSITKNGLSIQLASLLPRLIEKYTSIDIDEEVAARKASAALRKAIVDDSGALSRAEIEAGESQSYKIAYPTVSLKIKKNGIFWTKLRNKKFSGKFLIFA